MPVTTSDYAHSLPYSEATETRQGQTAQLLHMTVYGRLQSQIRHLLALLCDFFQYIQSVHLFSYRLMFRQESCSALMSLSRSKSQLEIQDYYKKLLDSDVSTFFSTFKYS
jgi:hypothetical protein